MNINNYLKILNIFSIITSQIFKYIKIIINIYTNISYFSVKYYKLKKICDEQQLKMAYIKKKAYPYFQLLTWYVYYFITYDIKLTFILNFFIAYQIWNTQIMSKYISFVFLLSLIYIYIYLNFSNIKLLSEYPKLKIWVNNLIILCILCLFLILFSVITIEIINIFNKTLTKSNNEDTDYGGDDFHNSNGEKDPFKPGPPNSDPSWVPHTKGKRKKVDNKDYANEGEDWDSLTKDQQKYRKRKKNNPDFLEYNANKKAEEYKRKKESELAKQEMWPYFEEKKIKDLLKQKEKLLQEQKKHVINKQPLFERAGLKSRDWLDLGKKIESLNARLEQAEMARVSKQEELDASREEYFKEHAEGKLEGNSSDWE